MKTALIVLALMVPMAANALCLGSNDTRCKDVFKMVTSEGYFVRWENNNKGRVVKGKVEGQGLKCGVTGGKIRKDGALFGRVYYDCGNLSITKMFSDKDKENWTAQTTGSFGVYMSGSVK